MDVRKANLKTVFKAEAVHKEFYVGGSIFLSNDGKLLFCLCNSYINIVNTEKGSISSTLPPEFIECNIQEDGNVPADAVLCFSLSSDEEILASAHRSGLITLWDWKNGKSLKLWKSLHKGVISKLAFSNTSPHLASGGSDSSIRVWDYRLNTCLYKLGGIQGVTSVLEYFVVDEKECIFASGDDGVIRGWQAGSHKQSIYNFAGHIGKVTSLCLSENSDYLISCGRDKVAIIWNITEKKKERILPLMESVETSVILPSCAQLPGYDKPIIGTLVAFAGESGVIQIWDVLRSKQVYKYSHATTDVQSKPITRMSFNANSNELMVITTDHNIFFYKLDARFTCQKQMVGCFDEVLDVALFGENESYLAVATNTSNISLYNQRMECTLLAGHTDIVLSLSTSAANPNLLASSSKDNSVRIWMMKDGLVNCVAVGSRHTLSVNSASFSHLSTEPLFLVSAGEDTTLKLWNLPKLKFKSVETLNTAFTQVAHDKAVNSVAVSFNNRMIATGSQDKTAKLWSSNDLSLLGVLSGHRRGIWCCKFSNVDKVLLTSSADCTLKIWSLTNMNCIKSLDNSGCSILRCAFLNNGSQIISCGTDGLVKLWLIKTGEEVATLDLHNDKVWALAVSSDESKFITGGADSRMIVWYDRTEEAKIEESKVNQEKVLQEQTLSNLMRTDQHFEALQLALTLERPGKVLDIIKRVHREQNNVEEVIEKLRDDQKQILLKFSCIWNTNSKQCYIAQIVFSTLVTDVVENKFDLDAKELEGALAYTDRHFKRLTKLKQDLALMSYTLQLMKPHRKSQSINF